MANSFGSMIGVYCSLDGTVVNYQGSAQELADRLMKGVTKPLAKKGLIVQPVVQPEQAAVRLQFVEIEQGNQLLRYLLPFLSPAFVELEAQVVTSQGDVRPFHYKHTAQVGVFGGSAKGMLGVCVDRLAKKVSKDVLRQIG